MNILFLNDVNYNVSRVGYRIQYNSINFFLIFSILTGILILIMTLISKNGIISSAIEIRVCSKLIILAHCLHSSFALFIYLNLFPSSLYVSRVPLGLDRTESLYLIYITVIIIVIIIPLMNPETLQMSLI